MLLSETELRSALEPLLDRLLTERFRLFELQLEPRLRTVIGAALQPQSVSDFAATVDTLLATQDPNQTFAALFEASRALTGAARALVVLYRDEAAVWKSEGVRLPDRFRLAEIETTLRASHQGAGSLVLRVRGTEVGLLYWEAAAALPADHMVALQRLVAVAELLLLAHGLPGPRASAGRAQPPLAPPGREPGPGEGSSPPVSDPATRFARLLLEDLELYLERERASELAQARRQGNAGSRFAAEIERCRRAFQERFPAEDDGDNAAFEAVAAQLGHA